MKGIAYQVYLAIFKCNHRVQLTAYSLMFRRIPCFGQHAFESVCMAGWTRFQIAAVSDATWAHQVVRLWITWMSFN